MELYTDHSIFDERFSIQTRRVQGRNLRANEYYDERKGYL
jgi:hypothetical protein